MITFNTILEAEGIDPKTVKMARHRDNRFKITPYSVFITDMEKYNSYQACQLPKKFDVAEYLAAFVVTPNSETLFTSFYKIHGYHQLPDDFVDPVSGLTKNEIGEHYFYDLELLEQFSKYKGRVIIDWGSGERAWVQWANKRPKAILEISKSFQEPGFPGFKYFSKHLEELNQIPESWKAILSSVSGVYLLAHIDSKRLYVGAAYGSDGFWGRWQSYMNDGHGGNVELKKLNSRNFQISVLEVCASSATLDEVIATETLWKEKLCSRSLGYNAN